MKLFDLHSENGHLLYQILFKCDLPGEGIYHIRIMWPVHACMQSRKSISSRRFRQYNDYYGEPLVHCFYTLRLRDHTIGKLCNPMISKTTSICTQVVFQVNNVKLPQVDRFKYLGSYVSRDCMMDEEIYARIQSASFAFGHLRKRVFDSRELTVKTKVKVYDQCIIPFHYMC